MSWKHKYAVTRCEACGRDLIEPGSVDLVYSIASQVQEVPSRLDSDGILQDVDGIIAKGLHSDTCCAACGHSLSDEEVLTDQAEHKAFVIEDNRGQTLKVRVEASGHGLHLLPDGYGNPVSLDFWDGELRLLINDDKDVEEPTIISLRGARLATKDER
jgi:hypothetical protein